MHKVLEEVCSALDALAEAITNQHSDDRPLIDTINWQFPPLGRRELADIPKRLAMQIRAAAPEELPEAVMEPLSTVPEKLLKMQQQYVPRFFSGEHFNVMGSYLISLEWLRLQLAPLLDWQVVGDPQAAPPKMARRIRALDARLKSIEPDMAGLERQIQTIRDGYAAADSLPVDLQNLQEARDAVSNARDLAKVNSNEISSVLADAKGDFGDIRALRDEATRIVAQCSEAYRATTSIGLAAAFDERARRLGRTMWVWVAGLVLSLGVGGFLGSQRIIALSSALASPQRDWGSILVEMLISVLTIGAPLWAAWLSTKQIGQRFRLMEDYAFKASVAKAYEGYRREAARIDPAFEARLFSNALTRLEEPPLRLVEDASHGSPWHELVTSDSFRSLMDKFPELKELMIDFYKGGLGKARSLMPSKKLVVEEVEPAKPAS